MFKKKKKDPNVETPGGLPSDLLLQTACFKSGGVSFQKTHTFFQNLCL